MSDENQHPITASIADTAAAPSSASTQPRKATTVSPLGGDTRESSTDAQYLLRNGCIRLKQFARWPVGAPCCNPQGVLSCPRPGILQRARCHPTDLLSLAPLHACVHAAKVRTTKVDRIIELFRVFRLQTSSISEGAMTFFFFPL